MMDIATWAARWGIPDAALRELAAPAALEPVVGLTGTSEAHVQTAQRLSAARAGIHAWRNNVGAGFIYNPKRDKLCAKCAEYMRNRAPVRWGLANDSPQLNERLKSADLIGIKPRLILPSDAGTIIGQFWCREVKEVGWHYTGRDREPAQLRYIGLVQANGGDAAFTAGGE